MILATELESDPAVQNAAPKIVRPRRRYTSPAMTERRARIVDTAHRLLGEGGVAALTIRRLSEEAGVAQRTLYRLFGDKDGVVSATVVDRMAEVRAHIARRDATYTLDTVFRELDWMVSELERDSLYARVVIDFVFSPEPREVEVSELTSVARSRFRGWLALEQAAGRVRDDLDLEYIVEMHVMHEFLVYRRWSIGQCDAALCRMELRACFLQTAALVLADGCRDKHFTELAKLQRQIMRARKVLAKNKKKAVVAHRSGEVETARA